MNFEYNFQNSDQKLLYKELEANFGTGLLVARSESD